MPSAGGEGGQGALEEEIYRLLSENVLDHAKLDALSDINFEASLMLRSKFLGRQVLKYEDVLAIHRVAGGKSALISARLEGYRFLVYIESGKIASSLMVNLKSGERVAGLKPLVVMAARARDSPIVANVYEVLPPLEEEKTRQVAQQEARAAEAEAPAALMAERVRRLREDVARAVEEVAAFYGCRVLSLALSISRGVLYVSVEVEDAGLLKKCKASEVERTLSSDIEVLALQNEVNLPVRVSVMLKK